MDYQKPLYKSKGILPKTKLFFQCGLAFFGIGGIILILLPVFTDAPAVFTFLGVIYIALGLLFPKMYHAMCNSRLCIYEDYIAGVAVNCTEIDSQSLFPSLGQIRNSQDPERIKFSLPFKEITDIHTINFLPQIILTHGNRRYQIAVKDLEKAYQILCDKVYGEVNADRCVFCGKKISTITENCPHCGHMTRYGKAQRDSRKKQTSESKLQIRSAIGVVIFVIGLIILVPAIIDLNEISSYAGLYASIYPSQSKNW